MDRTLRMAVTYIATVVLVASLLVATAVAPSAAQDAAGTDELALDDPAAVEALLEVLEEEIERTDTLIGNLEQARRQGYPAFVLLSGRVLQLTPDEAALLVAISRDQGGLPADPAVEFRLAEMFLQARAGGGLRDLDTSVYRVTGEEFEAYWERLSTIYGATEDGLRDHRERLVSVIDGLAAIAEEAEADASSDDLDDPVSVGELADAAGPFLDICVFRTGSFLDRSRFHETQVIAWKNDDFDPSWARFDYAAATPDEDAEDPNHRIEKMRRDASATNDVTIVFDGGFAGFCAWAASTCPNTNPKFGGEPVCEDGRPVVE